MAMTLFVRWLVIAVTIVTGSSGIASASLVGALAERKDLTPESLMRFFADFTFELSAERQDPETFLARKRGDCDDFAILASELLTARGYKTKLVVVMMQQESHVVCYVREARGFLDFNHRADARPIIESDGTLEEIGEKVAADFRHPWHLASEFRSESGRLVYVENAFPLRSVAVQAVAVSTPVAPPKPLLTNELNLAQAFAPIPVGENAVAQQRK
jgi:hypothetical protein